MATPAQHAKRRHRGVAVVVVLVLVVYAFLRTRSTAPQAAPGTLDAGGNLPTGPSGPFATGALSGLLEGAPSAPSGGSSTPPPTAYGGGAGSIIVSGPPTPSVGPLLNPGGFPANPGGGYNPGGGFVPAPGGGGGAIGAGVGALP